MELQLTFQNPLNTSIPIDYQYFLSSWIYGILSKGDETYARFLHDQGYTAPGKGKVFKLFSFSNLSMGAYEIRDGGKTLLVKSPEVSLKARFKVDQAVQSFVQGLFKDQVLKLKNGYNSMACFDVKTIETSQINIIEDKAIIQAKSPIVISTKNKNGLDQYLSPLDDGYADLFLANLFDKYLASGGAIKPEWQSWTPSFKLLYPQRIKSKLVAIKSDSRQETKVRGWIYQFELVAPKEVIEIGLLGGFGKECGMGFGFGEIIENKSN